MNRRALLQAFGLALSGTGLQGCRRGPRPAALSRFPGAQGETLRAALEQLLPEDPRHGLPGAARARVAEYVDQALRAPALRVFERLLQRGLQALAQRRFPQLAAAEQRRALAACQRGEIAGFDSAAFFEVLHTLALEGYLGAPQHGGNPGALSWRVLGIAALPEHHHP